ncbi:tetratricopeptide repeat protein [Chitinophagaceae bacterium LB-8]|uniref:Tetratricopeptide repeat protein n=1 Tax=Paraflavisolibacter caeni TaxID=2982496 RepID=A0A9X3B9S5_9BACT|nr:tetratricopeptide repeat protein [Paraflavisolibacter caeni]MCU7552395.1 tetratricopeptide repeat protein [Paraflavisolibacter caeni]
MKKCLILVCFLFLLAEGRAQSVEQSLAKGNQYYKNQQYDLAEIQYRKALEEVPNNLTAKYNLANSLYRQRKNDEALDILKNIHEEGSNKNLQSSIFYNTGVIYTRQKSLEASIEAYKSALRLNPDDKEARENLQKALLELKKEQQNRQNQQQQNKMSQNEAQRRLQQLQQKEKDIQQRLQNQNKQGGGSMPKDW